MIEQMIFDKIADEIRVAKMRDFTGKRRPLDIKVTTAYRCGLSEALRLVKRVLQIEEE
jgi:hypothetical protein